MTSSPKTINAASKAAATCKAKALGFVEAHPATDAVQMPKAWSRWLRTLEMEGKIVYRNGFWSIA